MPVVTVTKSLLNDLYAHSIFFKYNSPPPSESTYGWLTVGKEIITTTRIRMEQNSGLFDGAYKPMVGGRKGSGLATIGAFSYSYSPLPDRIKIGRYCSISRDLKIMDSSHPISTLTSSAFIFRPKNTLFSDYQTQNSLEYSAKFRPATFVYPVIGNDVWIGDNVTLSNKVSIGHGAVVAANSTVVKDIPPYAIVGGNPAKIIRYRFADDVIHKLIESEWWDYHPSVVFADSPENVESILQRLENADHKKYEFSFVET